MRLLLTLLFVVGLISANAAPKIKLNTNKGKWSTSSAWDLNRIPQSGDTVIIPAKDTLVIDGNLNLGSTTFYVKVYGALFFEGGGAKLTLAETSTVAVYTGGTIYSTNSPSQILSIGGFVKYEGNGTSISGPMIASRNTSSFMSFLETPTTLPVKFIGFTAVRNTNDVLIQWATSQEINAAVYEIQRSEDGANWKTISTVKAAGNTNAVTNYAYTDKNVNLTTAYYRVKQIDADNRTEYTAVRTVKANASAALINAVGSRGTIVMQFPEKVRGQVEVSLISLGGQVVSRQVINQPFGQIVLPTKAKGNFIVRVSNQQEVQVSKQILL